MESGWGKSTLTSQYNNLFGIKDFTGGGVAMTTQEYYSGFITIVDKFKIYNSYEDSIADHSDFLVENSRYRENGVFDAQNYIEQANAIQAAGYATDPNYANSLINLIETYNLNIFDGYEEFDTEIYNLDESEIVYSENQIDFDILMEELLKHEGKPYKMIPVPDKDSNGIPVNFDCSSIVQYSFKMSLNINLPRTAEEQYYACDLVPLNEAVPGDLVFYKNTYITNSYITHVEVYVGENTTYGAGSPVGFHNLNSQWAKEHVVCAGRIKIEK